KAPDVPSILIETGYISNPSEEKKLRSRSYQRKLAQGIFDGIKRYVSRSKFRAQRQQVVDNSPRVHIVQPGDTLSAIARIYGIRVDALRFANNMSTTQLKVGSRLIIP
ncbi:MAG: LysM peptidoglycan-binding domain-containing protein, partial [Acidiferrobacterales bacterium]